MKKTLLFISFFFLSSLALVFSSFSLAITIPKEGKLPVPGGNVWYSIKGTGKATPLVLIHGGPGGSSCSFGVLAALGKNRPVIFYDQLGAGKSDQPTDKSLWQINRFVEELSTLLKSLNLPKVHLLAHSWGAAIAGQFLMDKGTAGIESVIYVGPLLSSKDWVEGTNELRLQLSAKNQAIMYAHELAGTTDSQEYQDAADEFYSKFLFHVTPPDSDECNDSAWNQDIYEQMWGNSEFFVSGNLKDFDATKNLKDIKIPTLFLVGEFDEARESTVRKYQQQMPNAQVVVLKNAAHMSMIDEPQAFIKTVNDFLNSVDKKQLVLAKK